jgi:hypothetical protein
MSTDERHLRLIGDSMVPPNRHDLNDPVRSAGHTMLTLETLARRMEIAYAAEPDYRYRLRRVEAALALATFTFDLLKELRDGDMLSRGTR